MHPTKETLIDLVHDARKGEVVLPEFQRSFIWERRAIEELLVSILNNYFIGAFLTLDVLPDNPPFRARKIEGHDDPSIHAKTMVLDGQQRLTSVHYALYGPDVQLKNTSYPYRFFLNIGAALEGDWEEAVYSRSTASKSTVQTFNELGRQYEQDILAFSAMRSWEDWTRWYDGYRDYHRQQGTFDEDRTDALSKLVRRFLTYQVASIGMPQETSLETVVEVFERINSTGSPLSVFELLTARLWKHEIYLRELWEASRNQYGWLGRMASDKSERYPKFTLQLMALLRGKECKRKDLILLDPEDFEGDWETSAHYLNHALSRIHSTSEGGYGVVSAGALPYSTLTPPLAALLQHIDNCERGQQDAYSKLHHWYWGSVFTERYGGPVETLSQRDYLQVSHWMSSPESPVPDAVPTEKSQTQRDLKQVVRQGAVYKGIMCLIALRGATDFFSGDTIELHTLDDHHVFPQDFLKPEYSQDERNTILNRTLIASDTNRRIIRAKRPSVYLAEMEKTLGETKALEILRSHFIDAAGRDAMRSDDFKGFLRARESALRQEIERRCVYSSIGLSPVQQSSETVAPGEENQRLDRVETALRDSIDETLIDAFGDTYWKQVVPGDIRSSVEKRLQKQVDAKREVSLAGSSRTRAYLDFCDFSDYERLIFQKNLWPSFSSLFTHRGDCERHLVALRRYRNAIKHGREVDGVTRLNGTAATIWMEGVLGIKDFVDTIPAAAEATKEDCLRVLVRRSIPSGQQQLYAALVQAPNEGLSSEELVKATGRRNTLDLSGVLGPLGLRINATPGYGAVRKPGIGMVLDVKTNRSGAKEYKLRPRMVEALLELNPPWLPERKTAPLRHTDNMTAGETRRTTPWDEASFLAQLEPSNQEIANRLLQWGRDRGFRFEGGRGAQYATLYFVLDLEGRGIRSFYLYEAYRAPVLHFQFDEMGARFRGQGKRAELAEKINNATGSSLSPEMSSPSVSFDLIREPSAEARLFEVLDWVVEQVNGAAWNGRDFYVSLGEGEHRTWEDCRRYGFISGGQGKWYSQTLTALFPGARVFVNIPRTGFVGVGEVTGTSTPVAEFKVSVHGIETSILEVPVKAPNMGEHKDDPELCEYMVAVKWLKAVPREEAYWEKGLFAIQHTACHLRDQLTIDRLTRHFELEDSSGGPLTPAQQLWLDYWAAFGQFLENNKAGFSPPKPQKRHWVSWGIGRSGFELSAIVSSRDKHVDVLLYLGDENSKAHFHLLSSMKDVIEEQLGFALEWLEKPDQKGSSILVTREAETTDRDSWPDLHAWTLEKMTAFDRVFRPLVRDLDASEWEPPEPVE